MMEESNFILLLVSNKNQRFTELCLNSLERFGPSCDLIRIDVKDNREDEAEKIYNEIEKLKSLSPSGKYLCILKNDIELTYDWHGKISKLLEFNPSVGVISPMRILKDSGELYNIGFELLSDARTKPLYAGGEIVRVDCIDSSCMIFRPNAWIDVEWDSMYRVGYADVDVCQQVMRLEYMVACTSVVHVYQNIQIEVEKEFPTMDYFRFKSKWGIV